MTPAAYLKDIVDPALAEMTANRTSERHLFVACLVVYHMIDFLDGVTRKPILRGQLRAESPAYAALDRMANALKPARPAAVKSGAKAAPGQAEAKGDEETPTLPARGGAVVDRVDAVIAAAQFLRGKILSDAPALAAQTSVTYYVVIPFDRNADGFIVPGVAQETASVEAAERRARRLADEHEGVVAFSRSGDHGTGEFQDAVILSQYGEVDLNVLSR